MSAAPLTLREFSVAFGCGAREAVASDRLSLDVAPGGTLALVGEAGWGKPAPGRIGVELGRADRGAAATGRARSPGIGCRADVLREGETVRRLLDDPVLIVERGAVPSADGRDALRLRHEGADGPG